MKKITINKTEEIELNERQEKIYNQGYEAGGWMVMALYTIALISILLIVAIKTT